MRACGKWGMNLPPAVLESAVAAWKAEGAARNNMKRALFCAALLLAAALPSLCPAQTPGTISAGHEIAKKFCSRCHAIEMDGASPLPSAPPFRDIVAKGHVENLRETIGEGVIAGHPAMPQFQFGASEAGELIAYLKSLSGKG